MKANIKIFDKSAFMIVNTENVKLRDYILSELNSKFLLRVSKEYEATCLILCAVRGSLHTSSEIFVPIRSGS